MVRITGGCLCGKVRYSADADPISTALCHCHNCLKASGSVFTIVVAVPQKTLNVQCDRLPQAGSRRTLS
jgi:hypothetical protein